MDKTDADGAIPGGNFDPHYELEDRYRLQSGSVFLTGTQALTRLPMMQRQRDLAAGLNTAGFISGYRGSPLGNYDMALWQAQDFLEKNGLGHMCPGSHLFVVFVDLLNIARGLRAWLEKVFRRQSVDGSLMMKLDRDDLQWMKIPPAIIVRSVETLFSNNYLVSK